MLKRDIMSTKYNEMEKKHCFVGYGIQQTKISQCHMNLEKLKA